MVRSIFCGLQLVCLALLRQYKGNFSFPAPPLPLLEKTLSRYRNNCGNLDFLWTLWLHINHQWQQQLWGQHREVPFSHTQKWNHSKAGVLFYLVYCKFWNSLTKIQMLGWYQNQTASKSSASASPQNRASKPVWIITTHYLPRLTTHAIVSLNSTLPQTFFFLSSKLWSHLKCMLF